MSCQADAPLTAEPNQQADEQVSQRHDQPQARRGRLFVFKWPAAAAACGAAFRRRYYLRRPV